MPVWHASISWQPRRRTERAVGWPAKVIGKAKKRLRKALDGVGGPLSSYMVTDDDTGVAIHLQRPLTPDEIERLPDGWMSIPATDERGDMKEI